MELILEALKANNTRLQNIRSSMTREELLAGLAEECGEGVRAALHLRRAIDGANPTKDLAIDADENLWEEIGDILLYAYTIGIDERLVAESIYKKSKRWTKRLGIE